MILAKLGGYRSHSHSYHCLPLLMLLWRLPIFNTWLSIHRIIAFLSEMKTCPFRPDVPLSSYKKLRPLCPPLISSYEHLARKTTPLQQPFINIVVFLLTSLHQFDLTQLCRSVAPLHPKLRVPSVPQPDSTIISFCFNQQTTGQDELLSFFSFALPIFHCYGHKASCQVFYK